MTFQIKLKLLCLKHNFLFNIQIS